MSGFLNTMFFSIKNMYRREEPLNLNKSERKINFNNQKTWESVSRHCQHMVSAKGKGVWQVWCQYAQEGHTHAASTKDMHIAITLIKE